MYLYEKIDAWREADRYAELPRCITDNLNPRFELREYQKDAFCNFITYFESRSRQKPTKTLFHMATGSGKTLIMAGLILYLYKQGYRNFLFFVNLSNIVVKTKDNFLTKSSTKYLFNETVSIDGKRIKINEVANFQGADGDAVNICFTTTQGLHTDMQSVKENAVSFADFSGGKTALISDEAHHLSAGTKKPSAEQAENARHWESTVESILCVNPENVLLEFTATCDVKNAEIRAKYEDKIVFDYPLLKFREDGYSKEIKTLRSDSTVIDRALQAAVLSEYRRRVFSDNRLDIKPVVMYKSNRIKDNAANKERFIESIEHLNGERIAEIFERLRGQIPVMQSAYEYFKKDDPLFDRLAAQIRDGFSRERCISASDDDDVEKNQRLLNSLEDADNPYRAVFAVDKLNEGWDVLNLFDIVRLYETRDSRDGKPGTSTIAEAQLIGRGARYCPFELSDEGNRNRRKYDGDVENPLRICETLYYHCLNEPKYINELHTALKEIGLSADNAVTAENRLKESFKNDEVYSNEYIFANKRRPAGERAFEELLTALKNGTYTYDGVVGRGGEDVLFEEIASGARGVTSFCTAVKLKDIAARSFSAVHCAMRRFDALSFDKLKARFPRLKSAREFVTCDEYLGGLTVGVTSRQREPEAKTLFGACLEIMNRVADELSKTAESFEGADEFVPIKINEIIGDKSISCTPIPGGRGVSQRDFSVDKDCRIDLSEEDWFVFEDNFGTSEEKAFAAYFKKYADALKASYDKVFLIRNERQVALYSFDGGYRFEPDFILLLIKGKRKKLVFIEPKGEQLLEAEKWKEEFLLQIKDRAVVKDESYEIEGFHFFNSSKRAEQFDKDILSLSDEK